MRLIAGVEHLNDLRTFLDRTFHGKAVSDTAFACFDNHDGGFRLRSLDFSLSVAGHGQ